MPTPPAIIRRYYPTLASVVSLDDFPESLGFLKQAIQSLFDKIHYKDLQYKKSPKGDAAFYSLTIVSKKLAVELFGSGVSLVLNPDDSNNPDFYTSAFPVTVEYQWKILAYLRQFDLKGFSFTPQEFYELGLQIFNISEEQALARFIYTFTEPIDQFTTPLRQFINDLNAFNQSPVINELNLTIDENTSLSQVVKAINEQTGKYATLLAFGAYLLKNNLNETKQKVAAFFKKFVPDDLEEYIKDLLVPKAKATLMVSAAVEFQRNILYPYHETSPGIWEREPENSGVLSRFHFGKILLYADTQEGIGYKMDLVGNLAPKFSEIGNTGLLIQLERLKLDLSDKVNIEEADADGRPASFKGVYADALSVTLPSKWFKTAANTNQSTLRIGGYNLLVGTGGVSGKFALEAVPTQNPLNGQITDFFSNHFTFVFPITGLKNNTTTNQEESVVISNQAGLLTYLNSLDNKNLYAFKFPLKITPAGGAQKELKSQQELRAYITDIINGQNGTMWFNIGSETNGFLVGFKSFDITFKQSKVISSNIKGALEIKKFTYPQGTPNAGQVVHIDIEGHLADNGDFNLTASAAPPYPITLKDVFTYNIKSLELGKQDNDYYIGTSGSLQFEGFLKDTLHLGPIDIDRLRIYSDGSIEFSGGSIHLLKPIVLSLGPVEITVSAIHYGSHQKEVNGTMRKFNYFGFDGGISVDPLGIEIRGDGAKYYYCTDEVQGQPKPRPYLHIQTLYLDLTIPASSPAAIINGWLSIPEPGVSKEYAGGIKIQLPKAKISGRADMKLMPKYPAFIIDAEIEFPAPIPLGTFAIYGFRGLLGYRYVAEKEAAGLVSGVNTWYEYYKAPPRGIHVQKFNGPDKTKASGTPFSIGAGASLGTSFDNGTVINIKAMVLLSIPSLFMIDGRAAILSARLGLTDTKDPPFFAFVALGDNSLEFGFGADFKMPTSSGSIISLYADVQAGFFFKNQHPWYVNIGTKTNPITARILTLITLKSYLMLSAKGIEAGARGEFNFDRKYGIIKVRAWAYIEVGGHISFEKPQFGAYLAAGVGAEINIKIVELYVAIDILFGVEAPKPFLIYGKFRLCVKIKIAWIFKFKFCGNLEVMWEFNKDVDRTPINPMINESSTGTIPQLVKGVNMLSNEVFELAYLPAPPSGLPQSFKDTIIPLDTYVDIKSEKGFLPNAVGNLIGGVNNPPEKYTDLLPPEKTVKGKTLRQVKHQYSIENLVIKSWNGSSWVDYHPYKALYPNDPAVNSLKVGQFQKSDGQYNTIRILATNPFSYTEQGQPGWFVPEQNGITAATLFCKGKEKTPRCANFLAKPLNTKYYCYDENYSFYANDVSFYLMNKTDDEYASVTNEANVHGFAQSLAFNNNNKLRIILPQASTKVDLRLSTFSQSVTIKYYSTLIDDNALEPVYGNPDPYAANPAEPYVVTRYAYELNNVVGYMRPDWKPVSKIVIEPQFPNANLISSIMEQIDQINFHNDQVALGVIKGEYQSTAELEEKLWSLRNEGCKINTASPPVSSPPVSSPPTGDPKLCEFSAYLKETLYASIVYDAKDPFYDNWHCFDKMLAMIKEFDASNPQYRLYASLSREIEELAQYPERANPPVLNGALQLATAVFTGIERIGGCNTAANSELCEYAVKLRSGLLGCVSAQASFEENWSCFIRMIDDIKKFHESHPQYRLWEYLVRDVENLMSYPDRVKPPVLSDALQLAEVIFTDIEKLGGCNGDETGEIKKCFTMLHQVCWLSLEDYQFNINIPSQQAIEQDSLAAVDSITKFIQPVWRPDTSYYVHFTLKDTVDDGANQQSYGFVYGFTTAGPVGFFHTNDKATYGDIKLPNGNILEDANGIVRTPAGAIVPADPNNPLTAHPDKYALTSLKQYIDYNRSYPNADGNLLSAKPLFYNDKSTVISLYFSKAYATHFFQDWAPYNGLAGRKGRLKIVIKDPREGTEIQNPPYLDYDPNDTLHITIPQTIEAWQDDENPQVPFVISQYLNMYNNKECFVTGGAIIKPKSKYAIITPKHLKPLKLYTAIVNNLYDLNNDGTFAAGTEIREVHKFGFQTSRYANFKEQVNSYLLKDGAGAAQVEQKAIFEIAKAFTPQEVEAAYKTIMGQPDPLSDGIALNYQHAYDRIFEGILGFKPLNEAISTEFNFIRNMNNNNVIAVIIRNPEPFNIPKIPLSDGADTIVVMTNNQVNTTYRVMHSKDYSQVIIMHDSREITATELDFRFQYKTWNGTQYTVDTTNANNIVLVENIQVSPQI